MSGKDSYQTDDKPDLVVFARHFPPHVSGGARRPYFLVKALQALGCRVFVIAPALPDDIEGVAVPHIQPDPATTSPVRPGIKDMLRDWLFWPDPDIRWTKRAVRAARAALPFKPDWVITTSPPESIHFAGQYLKRALGCHWYADMRDHWLVRPFRRQRTRSLRKYIERKIASHMLRKADLISAVNEQIADEVRAYIGETEKIFVLPHFSISADTEEFLLPTDTLNLVYTGSFSLSDPDCGITQTLEALSAALQGNPTLHLHIAGRLSEAEEAQIRASQCAQNITLHGVIPLQKAHALQRAADALLLASSPHMDTPPGKAAEYAIRGKPIIAITKAKWASQYNGDSTAVENLIALNTKTPRVALVLPPSQSDAAAEILHKMAKFGKH